MANFFKDNEDLRFYVERALEWEPLVALAERDFKQSDGFKNTDEAVDFYGEVLNLVGEFAANEVAPRAAQIDREGISFADGEALEPPVMQRLMKQMKQLELFSLAVPREMGGMNAPGIVYFMTLELMARADVSVCAHYGFHGGMAMATLFYSLVEGSATVDRDKGEILSTRFDAAIAEMSSGKAWGSMDLTEANAGSDLAALRSKAELDEDGVWRITGEKIFITSGHGKYHYVIARTEPRPTDPNDPMAGLGGLSLFFVKAYEGAGKRKKWLARVERVEEKLGHHGSATVTITFDRVPGELVGKRGEGFKQMLLLMNNARVGVGFEAIGLCESALRMARDYAAERPSMGKRIDQHEMIADYLDEMQTDIQGLRALSMYACFHEELAQRNRIAAMYYAPPESLEQERYHREMRRHTAKARAVTPLLKYLAAEKAVEIAKRGVQIHGGVGYTTEYGAEKLLRDAMVLPIYEGTSQIQALMAMKDALGGIMKNPQGFVRKVAQARWRAVSARDPLEKRLAKLQSLSLAAQQHLVQRTATDKLKSLGGKPVTAWADQILKSWDPKRDFSYAMLHAESLARLMVDVAISERLWSQAQRFPERRELMERYLERAEPRCRFLHDKVTTTGDRLLALLAAAGGDAAQSSAS
jgi:3-(methylthio)propanoyl-CoA dehydrogenase